MFLDICLGQLNPHTESSIPNALKFLSKHDFASRHKSQWYFCHQRFVIKRSGWIQFQCFNLLVVAVEDGMSNEPTTEATKNNPVQAVDDASTTKDESGWSNRNQKGLQISGYFDNDWELTTWFIRSTNFTGLHHTLEMLGCVRSIIWIYSLEFVATIFRHFIAWYRDRVFWFETVIGFTVFTVF